ncbi:MAG: hypothetical protein LBO20_05310, partial [Bifidobacteriaceae bacterium]|nr:hypothetical protein [Bifidobacteriaceae bacterium]
QGLILGFAAALLGAAFIFTGCESPTDGSAGAAGPVVIPAEVSPSALQAAIDSGAPIIIGDTEVSGTGIVDFKTAGVTLNGKLSTKNGESVVFSVAKANVIAGTGASVVLTNTTDVLIVSDRTPKVTTTGSGKVAKTVLSADDVKNAESGDSVAIENYTLSATAADTPSDVNVFVLGTLTVTGTSAAPTGNVYALGDTLVTATVNVSSWSTVTFNYSTLKSSGEAAITLTTPTQAFQVKAIEVADAAPLTIAGATGLTAKVTGPGTLTLSGVVAQAKITGDGKIKFANGTTATAFVGTSEVYANSISAGTIEFVNGFSTSEYAKIELDGDVVLADTKAITFGHADGTVALKAGSTVKVGTVTLLTADTDTLLTPTATAALTASSTGKTLTLGTADLTLTSGKLAVPAGAELVLNNALTVASGASLVLTAGATTTGAKISGTIGVKADATIIKGGWQAVGASGTVTIAENAITASAAGAVLTGGTSGEIGVTAGSLTVTGTIDVSAVGTVKLTGNGTIAGSLLLKGGPTPGLLLVDSDKTTAVTVGGSVTTSNFLLKDGSDTDNTKAIVTKDGAAAAAGLAVKGADANATSGTLLGSISGGSASPANDAKITGQTVEANVSSIGKGWKVHVPNT